MKQLEIDGKSGTGNSVGIVNGRIHYIPEFTESGAENFFMQFEKIAEMKKWKKEDWAFLVQAKFKDKACDTFNCLTLDESRCYETVKEAVLKTVQVDP